MSDTSGRLIVAMGIPGCGKSSVFSELARLQGWEVFHEPEEGTWPDAVKKREVCGRYTAITWFRSARVPQLYEAGARRDAGATVLVDSYFDKLLTYYLGSDGMDWLMPVSDPYYGLTRSMARLDRRYLPDADVIVSFEVAEDVWHRFLRDRGRALDRDAGFLESFRAQVQFIRAVEAYCQESGARAIRFQQTLSSPLEAARSLAALIQ